MIRREMTEKPMVVKKQKRIILSPTINMLFFFSRALPSFLALRSSNMAAGAISRPRLRGVVFDMDGTLTVPAIDFAAMYRQVLGDEEYRAVRAKNPVGVDILGIIDSWSPPRQREAYGVIAKFERQGLERLQIMPGATEVCQFLDTRQIRRGLITRNMKTAVDLFHEKIGLEFSPALSREFRPYKPDPAPLLHICSAWNIRPDEVIMVGDSLKDDVACGKRAGSFTCLLDETGRYSATDFSVSNLHADFRISSLGELCNLLEEKFELDSLANCIQQV